MKRSMRQADAVVVGGGLAGSALAIHLSRAGRHVVLIEKETAAHHKVCGEFLSGEAIRYLNQIGADPIGLGAVPIERVRLIGRRLIGEAGLPFSALSLSRHRLDEALLQMAAASGVELHRGQRVESFTTSNNFWVARTGEKEHRARTAFLATGKHDLSGWRRPAGRQPGLIGFKMHWRLPERTRLELAAGIELVLFPGGYAGLSLIEDQTATLCLLIDRETFKRIGGQWAQLLAHMLSHSEHLQDRLDGAHALWPSPLAISSIPYGYVSASGDGPWRLGDQAGVIPSFAGSGMSIALHSAWIAASAFLAGSAASSYQERMASDIRQQIRLAIHVSKALVSRWQEPIVRRAVGLFPQLLSAAASATRLSTV